MNAFIKKAWPYICALIAIILVIIIISSFALTKNEKMFVEVYKEYVESTLENPDSIEITSITEYTDENGGVVVHLGYKYTTDVGYSKSDSFYVVTNTITIDATLIHLGTSSYYENAVKKYNGQSVEKGFMTKSTSTLWGSSDEIEIINLWMAKQATSNWNAYDIDKINNAIK